VVEPLGPVETIQTPGPREAPPLPLGASEPVLAPVAQPYVGSPSRPGVAAPGGGAPSFNDIPPAKEWAGPTQPQPAWAETPLHGHATPAPQKKTLVVVEEVPERRSPVLLWVSAGVAAVVGMTATWAVLSTREPQRIVVTVPAKVEPPPEPVKVEPPPPEPVKEPVAVVVAPTPEPVVDAGAPLDAVVDPPRKPPVVAVRPRPTKIDPPPPPPPPPAASDELVDFRVRPFGTVTVDGKVVGDTPFPPVKLSPGVHTIQIVNRELNKTVLKSFEVKAGAQNVFRLNLEETN
jgi:serine/threonine-protein kinase